MSRLLLLIAGLLLLTACVQPGNLIPAVTPDAGGEVKGEREETESGLAAQIKERIERESGTAAAVPDATPSAMPAPTATPLSSELQMARDRLKQLGPAPEILNEVWINSEPLRLTDLRGQVVIVEFWTYG